MSAAVVVDRDAASRRLVELYAERVRLTRLMAAAQSPTRQDAEAVLDAGRALDKACEAFRVRFYPRRHRVAVGLYAVFTASRTGASVETVLDLADEYLPAVSAP